MTMFKFSIDKDTGYFQVVTNSANKKDLEALGFVDHIDKVRAPAKPKAAVKPKPKAATNA